MITSHVTSLNIFLNCQFLYEFFHLPFTSEIFLFNEGILNTDIVKNI